MIERSVEPIVMKSCIRRSARAPRGPRAQLRSV